MAGEGADILIASKFNRTIKKHKKGRLMKPAFMGFVDQRLFIAGKNIEQFNFEDNGLACQWPEIPIGEIMRHVEFPF